MTSSLQCSSLNGCHVPPSGATLADWACVAARRPGLPGKCKFGHLEMFSFFPIVGHPCVCNDPMYFIKGS